MSATEAEDQESGRDALSGAVPVAVAAADGIGPEIVTSAIRVAGEALDLVGAPSTVKWIEVPIGRDALDASGDALPAASLALLEETAALVLGPVDHASYPRRSSGARQNPSGEIRKRFDLFANVRPALSMVGVPAVASDVDLVVVRENTEGLYADRNLFRGYGELMPTPEVALSIGVFTRQGVERVVRYALELAGVRRRHLTVVHKANVLPETTGMFLEAANRLQAEFPDVHVDDLHVDAMAAAVVRRPESFDVIVTENLFGDILSDLTAELTGSLGLAGSLNAGHGYAMAQAAHGSAPDIAGRGVANPTSMILSVALLIEWLAGRYEESGASLRRAAALIQDAVVQAVRQTRTPDIGGTATTVEFTDAVIATLRAGVRG
jgi:3-isopropylmalate dehydrogenase